MSLQGIWDLLRKNAPELYQNMIESQSGGTFEARGNRRHLYLCYTSKNGRMKFCYNIVPFKKQQKTKFRKWAAFIYKVTKRDSSETLTRIVYTASKKTAARKALAWYKRHDKAHQQRENGRLKQELDNIVAFYHLQQVDEAQHRVVKKLFKVRYADGTEKRISYKELGRLADQVPTIEPEHLHLLMVLHKQNGQWVSKTGEVVA